MFSLSVYQRVTIVHPHDIDISNPSCSSTTGASDFRPHRQGFQSRSNLRLSTGNFRKRWNVTGKSCENLGIMGKPWKIPKIKEIMGSTLENHQNHGKGWEHIVSKEEILHQLVDCKHPIRVQLKNTSGNPTT